MDLRDSLNRYYYDVTVSDLRQISRTGGGELSYNSIMYLDVISYQRAQGQYEWLPSWNQAPLDRSDLRRGGGARRLPSL